MSSQNDHPVVLITGATRNTGYATAEKFAAEGYHVCITSRDEKAAESAAQEISAQFPDIRAVGFKMITKNPEQIKSVFNRVDEQFGRLDVLVANATDPGYKQSILSTSEQDFDHVMSSNAKGYFFCVQAAAHIMIRQKSGSIVLIGSVHGVRPLPNRIVYGASKAAIASICRSTAYELGPYGIRCNLIVAGAIYNNRWDPLTQEEIEARRKNWPLGKESQPEDIAKAVYFLASDQSPTITGCELAVDSGVSVCLLQYDRDWNR